MGPMSFTLSMSGSVQSDPSSITDATSLLSASIDLAFKANYDASIAGNIPIAGTFTPALGAMAKVRFLSVRAVDGQSLVASVSWAGGTNQQIPVSDLLVLRANNTNDAITAVSISGTGRIEFIIAGNKT